MTKLGLKADAPRWAIYTRISEDDADKTGLGVARQETDCRALVARRGGVVARVFTDNDVSASNGKTRPDYTEAMRLLDAGEFDGLAIWDVDRFTRTPREMEDFIDLADRRPGLELGSVGGEIDIATPQGRMMLRIKATVARHEVEQMSRRIRRKSEERAAAGTPVGPIGYGFRRPNGRDEAYEPEAAIIRELARRVLDGESLRSLASDLNDRGVLAPRGKAWESRTIRALLKRANIAGLRQHRGAIVGDSTGDAIVDRDTFDRLTALFNDPRRKAGDTGKPPSHLLSGIARCGLCGGAMRVNSAWDRTLKNGKTYRVPAGYACKVCFKLRREESAVDEFVTELMIARLSNPAFLEGFDAGDRAAETDARDAIAAIDARLDIAADQFADGAITGDQLRRITERLRAERATQEQTLTDAMPRTLPAILTGPNPAERWKSASLEQRRAAVAALMRVTINRPTRRGAFDAESIGIDWL